MRGFEFGVWRSGFCGVWGLECGVSEVRVLWGFGIALKASGFEVCSCGFWGLGKGKGKGKGKG